ncbi:MAG: tRNA dihydrouridine synthase DusB [Clostridia bacterium]|nr:tRNA dihydrouridine synthase DusB [Clostridia bacterium]
MIRIGEIILPYGLMLAPMAGYTDHAMRVLCRENGAEYCVGEMVSAKAVCFGDKKTPALARIFADEFPCAVQLFGSDPDYMAEAARRLSDGVAGGVRPAAIDINMGCPVAKVAGNGEGSALMRDPPLVERIVAAVRRATDLPVTVKIRAGWDEEHKNAPEVARAAEAGGASLITVHARTKTAMYSGKADPCVVKAVKTAVSVPVVGNGDITDAASALAMLETGCDGLMIGRAAVGNPFVFRKIEAALEGKEEPSVTPQMRYEAAMRELSLRVDEKGEENAVLESRKLISAYFRGFPDAAACRAHIHTAETAEEMRQILLLLRSLT